MVTGTWHSREYDRGGVGLLERGISVTSWSLAKASSQNVVASRGEEQVKIT